MSAPDNAPTVTFRAVLALIQAERDEASARCPAWRSCSASAEYVAAKYEFLGADEVLGRLEAAILRLRQEMLR